MGAFKFTLGRIVKEKDSEFEGIVSQRTEHQDGPNTYGVIPLRTEEGDPLGTRTLEEGQIEELVEEDEADEDLNEEDGEDSNEENDE